MTPTALDAILAPGGLSMLFQPIVEVQGDRPVVCAAEALARGPRGSTMESAEILFDYVRAKRQQIAVDRACVAKAIEAAEGLPTTLDVSINVHAVTLSRDPGFLCSLTEAAEARHIALSRIVVEIVEHAPEWADAALLESLDALRRSGIRIALDDVGLGQSNYRMILDCRPDYFKIDRYFVQGCHRDFYRRAVIESIAHLAGRFSGCVIAEGIEDPRDLETVGSLGIGLAQGYLFGRATEPSDLAAQHLRQTRMSDDVAPPRTWRNGRSWGSA
jgi:EAL domain-containing protein (putative c-di-GMP-specific phosphodiesterase class I)